ncbi:hypothetical protein M8J77_021290 [Diaphorina citri]|nr:hypothetical protein M8J77_021290 [Diaphorina citri]
MHQRLATHYLVDLTTGTPDQAGSVCVFIRKKEEKKEEEKEKEKKKKRKKKKKKKKKQQEDEEEKKKKKEEEEEERNLCFILGSVVKGYANLV